MPDQPVSATIFAFNVGFGDCVLLRFTYHAAAQRHVLIDFGSTRYPDGKPKNFLTKVARQISELCNGKLDIVVATHRHKDHIYGFRTNSSGTAPGDIIRNCNPTIILQPWTEHPEAATNASVSPDQQEESRFHASSLRAMNNTARNFYRFSRQPVARSVFSPATLKSFGFLGENNIANKSSVKNLMDMGQDDARYLCFEMDVDLSDYIPGVSVDVLGPPTLEQSEAIRDQRARNEEEYWHLQARAARSLASGRSAAAGEGLFPGAGSVPSWAKWGSNRLKRSFGDSLMSIVRQLDRQMNNTSLILLFTVGGKSLLFPGDAQWENWSYALSNPEVKEKLRSVDIYKVGHHGSLNATPKTMWGLFDRRGDKDKPNRMTSIMSTKHGVHGHSTETAVPRSTLVTELRKKTHYVSTEDVEISSSVTEYYTRIDVPLG